jgi:hypothetical protein
MIGVMKSVALLIVPGDKAGGLSKDPEIAYAHGVDN